MPETCRSGNFRIKNKMFVHTLSVILLLRPNTAFIKLKTDYHILFTFTFDLWTRNYLRVTPIIVYLCTKSELSSCFLLPVNDRRTETNQQLEKRASPTLKS